MGDMADDYDYYLGIEDHDEDYRQTAKCRLCDSTDVYWSKENDLWALYGTNSRKHVCNSRVRTRRNLTAFDNLD